MYKFLLSTIFLSILVLSSCSSEQPNALTESDVEAFLQRVELEDKTLGPIVSSAYWIGANFITYDSQKVVADYRQKIPITCIRASTSGFFL
jgi:uncharacterized protein YcfL